MLDLLDRVEQNLSFEFLLNEVARLVESLRDVASRIRSGEFVSLSQIIGSLNCVNDALAELEEVMKQQGVAEGDPRYEAVARLIAELERVIGEVEEFFGASTTT